MAAAGLGRDELSKPDKTAMGGETGSLRKIVLMRLLNWLIYKITTTLQHLIL